MGYLGEDIKKLGFGLMRLPKDEEGHIDVEHTKKMVDEFIDAGFTYFDTAYVYPGSEEAIGEALVERYPRDSYTLTTKLAAWACKSREEAINQFKTSLERTGAGYFDFYLLHNLGEGRTHFFDDYKIWDFAQEMKKMGLIKHVGFSFHSTADELEEILKAHPEAEFVQLQINYADWESSSIQSRKCYEVARKYNKPIIVMEPIKGGSLANPPDTVKKVFDDFGNGLSYASWAIRFVASLDGILTVLSGMSSLDQMKDNISYMKDFKKLTDEEKEIVEKARIELSKIPTIPCTTCNYCAKVCPMNIGISGSFEAQNIFTLYNNYEFSLGRYNWLVKGHDKAGAQECIKCGQCESVCPQHIKIRDELDKVCETFHLR